MNSSVVVGSKSTAVGRVLIGSSCFSLGLLGLIFNGIVIVAIRRAGLLTTKKVGKGGTPIFLLVICVIVDGCIRLAGYALYLAPSIIAQQNLGDPPNELHGLVSHHVVQLLCAGFVMGEVSEVLIAINRLLVIKRMVLDGDFDAGFVDKLFSHRNCLIYAVCIYPIALAWQYGLLWLILWGYRPCCACV